ncbi:MAG TPA: hypothetical protein VKU02_06300 [Gemmataceae bacterium]|nr:hypothetical protein [Gemmataceae bacterium]
MAFNPFHGFRKHQKVVFAALTIVCMLTFIMAGGSFAGGDFFSELTRWVTGQSRTHEVATVYGKRISDREILELRRQRRLANQFIQQAVLQAQDNVLRTVEAENTLSQFPPQTREQLKEILQRRRFAPFMPREYLGSLQIYLFQLQMMAQQLETAKPPEQPKPELARLLEQLQVALQRDYWLFHTPKDPLYPEENLYFGGSTSEKGLLDFMIWRQQADRLGIVLLPEDIRNEYIQETLRQAPNTALILRQIGVQPDAATQQALVTALGDEFRVRMAQAALVGYDPGSNVGQIPASITPYEFWQYYRTNRTELSLKLLPIPVQKFLPEVKEQPSEADLQALFDKYKDDEAAPNKETPGFKQPRRMKLEWVSASPDSESYRKQAQHWLLSLVAAGSSQPFLPLALLGPVVSDYETLKWGHFRASPLMAADFAMSFYDYAYVERAENVASILAQVGGALGSGGNPFSPLVAIQSAAVARTQKELAPEVAHEAQRRLPLSGAFLAAATGLQPSLAAAAIVQCANRTDQFLPMEIVKRPVIQKVRETIASNLVSSSLDAFKTDLEAIRKEVETKKAKAADAEKRVEKAVQEHGWAHGAMSEPKDQYAINQDAKELAPLKEEYVRQGQYRDPKGKQFAQNLFFRLPADQWKLYTPQELFSTPSLDTSDKKTFLYWKTDDQPAKVLTFAQARPQVEAAWRLEKARALAKAKAEELAKQAKEAHGDFLPILNEASKQYGAVFDLMGVARWARPALTSRAEAFGQYQPYTVPEDKIEYPPPWPTFVDPLLESVHEKGDITVISNRPKDIYYVVALVRRDPPTEGDFYKESTGNRNLLLGQLEVERQKAYRLAFLGQLRDEANLTVNPEGLDRIRERPNLAEE